MRGDRGSPHPKRENFQPSTATDIPARPLRVVWSMLNLNPGFMGGTEEFASALMRALQVPADGHDEPATHIVSLTTRVGESFAIEGVEARVVRQLPGGRSFMRRLRVFASVAMPALLSRALLADAQVVFYPFTAMMPVPPRGIPSCVIVHDLQHLELPRNFTIAQRLYRSLTYDRRILRADSIVAVSESTRASVVTRLGVALERVRVIPPGIDGDFFTPAADGDAHAGRVRAQRSTGAAGPMLYYPARGLPHKNHSTLFKTMVIMRQRLPGIRLVLTGGDGDSIGPLPDGVTHEGRVSRERVRELYRTANALVFPSLFEGYGLPPLEAMACGTPVACSHAGSLPEVCGGAAELFDPHSPADMAAALERVLADPLPYRQRGLAHVKAHTVANSARQYEELWRELASG